MINLKSKQREIIKRMRCGERLEISVPEGNRVNKYYFRKDMANLNRRNVMDLFDEGLIKSRMINYCSGEFYLTELGKTIEL